MPLDGNGIWQYEETDIVSPFSDFMNLGMSSVSTELASVRSEVDASLPTQPVLGSNSHLVDLGVTLIAGWSFGTNYLVASGYVRMIYFNVVPTSSISETVTGDIVNVELTNVRIPGAHAPVLRTSISSDISGPSGTVFTIGENGSITLAALAPNLNWTGGVTRSFSGTYLANTYV